MGRKYDMHVGEMCVVFWWEKAEGKKAHWRPGHRFY